MSENFIQEVNEALPEWMVTKSDSDSILVKSEVYLKARVPDALERITPQEMARMLELSMTRKMRNLLQGTDEMNHLLWKYYMLALKDSRNETVRSRDELKFDYEEK